MIGPLFIPDARAQPNGGATLSVASATAPWIADLGDGTYKNPVLYADYSDPDAVRVGDDYWMTASSFSQVPGLPVLHSRDLVNWRLVNHALPRLVPVEHFSVPRPGEGVWAPSIRYHAGKFWIFYPDPDFGIYMITATDPAGAWSEPHMVKAGRGLIDPCPFWDDDGNAYLIHAWARSRAGFGNVLTLHRMAPDGTRVLDEGRVIIDGNQLPGWRTLEGPKFGKRDGWYYVFAPAGGVTNGYQAVFRARDIWGPYEERIVLEQGSTSINGPHQGAWVDTPSGEHWFLHFQDKGPYGRIVHLQPMRWRDDGWPVMGNDADGDGKGEPVLRHAKPALPRQAVVVPPTSDEFDAPRPGLQWQWQGNPRGEWIASGSPEGSLQLVCVPAAPETLWNAPNLFMQKFPAPEFAATTVMKFAPENEGETAGLIVFGYDYAWLGLRRTGNAVRLVHVICRDANNGGAEQEIASLASPASAQIWLRVEVDAEANCHFAYSSDGVRFESVGEPFKARQSRWVGAKAGLFAVSRSGSDAVVANPGRASFDWFRVSAPGR